ncbi:MAG: hypothetical protein VXX04_02950, partial [Actinomycetota bacterium]|nr:hypothetical protein [Actinomycetota bacterium]
MGTQLLTKAQANDILTPVDGCNIADCASSPTTCGCPDPFGEFEVLYLPVSEYRQFFGALSAKSDNDAQALVCPYKNRWMTDLVAREAPSNTFSCVDWTTAKDNLGNTLDTSPFMVAAYQGYMNGRPQYGICVDDSGVALPFPRHVLPAVPPYFLCGRDTRIKAYNARSEMVDVDFPITETDARVDILATNGSFYEAHNVMMNSLLYTFDGSANDGGGFAQINIKSRCKETGPCGKVSEGGYCPTAFLSNGLQAADVAGNCEADSTAAQEPMDLNLVMYTKASCCLTPGCTMFMTLRETCPDINYQTADVTNNNA